VAINKPGEGEKGINGEKGGNIGENKDDNIKKGIKKNISEKINKEPLLKKKKDLLYIFF